MNENQENESVEVEQNETNTEETLENTDVVDEIDNEDIEEKVFTQKDIDDLQEQIDELIQFKPEELSETELNLRNRAEQLWDKEVNLTLKEEGLEMFSDFIRADVDDADALNQQITKLKEIVGILELSNGFQPTDHKSVDGYSIAKKNRDTKTMISQKLYK